MKTMCTAFTLALAACSSAQPTSSMVDGEVTQGAVLTINPADPKCADFCVTVTSGTVDVGSAIEGIISWKDVPANSVLSLSLDRTYSDRQRIQNEKAEQSRNDPQMDKRFDGSLLTRNVPISDSGSIHFRWSGSGFACYQTEVPEICPGKATPGRHVISSKVMDKTALVHPFSHPDNVRRANPKVVFEGRSKPFEIY